MGTNRADIYGMTDTTCLACSTCTCGKSRLRTVREVAALDVMEHVSAPTLYRLIERGEFPARKVTPRKYLVLVTEFCPVHRVKARDDIDTWLEATGLAS